MDREPAEAALNPRPTYEELLERVARLEQQQAAELEAVFGAQTESIIVYGIDGVATRANAAARALLGFDPTGEHVGQNMKRAGTKAELGSSATARALRGETVVGEPFDYVSPDGQRRTVSASSAPMRDAEGRIIGAVTVSRDITERTQAELENEKLLAAVRDEKERLSALVNSIADEVWFCDAEKQFTLANPSAVREFNITSADAVDVQALARRLEVLRPDGSPRPVEEAPPLRALQGEVVRNQEEMVRTPASGELRYREVSASPVRDAAGRIIGSVSVVRDITERKRAEEAVREAHLRTTSVLEAIADAFYSLDDEWRFVVVNPAAERAPFGRPASELLGKVIWDVFPAIVGTRIHQHYLDAVAKRGIEHYEAQSPLNGKWYEVFMYPRPGGLDVYLRDIDERKRLEGLYRVLSQVNEAIVRTHDEQALCLEVCRIVAQEGQFPLAWIGLTKGTTVAPLACAGPAADYLREIRVELTGELGAGPTGTCVREDRVVLNDDFDSNRAMAPWRESARKHGFKSSASLPVHRHGEPIGALTLYAGTPGAFDPEQVKLLNSLCDDISYALAAIEQERLRSEAERALRESEQSLRESDRRKDEFLAVLSHELRSPLAPIRNSVYLLQHAPPGGEQARRAEQIIDRQSAHLTRLVDDLLDLNRISRGKIELQRERVDVAELTRRTAEDHRANFHERGVHLEVTIVNAPLWVHADPTRMAQVIGNLLVNACKFTPSGGNVQVQVAVEGNQAVLRVRDTGEGIAPELFARIFDPFTQAEQNIARSQGGLGLGLSLVKGFVELHGGSVIVASEGPGRGAEFAVRLPLLERVVFDEPRAAVAAARRGLRVLVIEDNRDAAESLRDVLAFLGHEARAALDGGSGVAAAREMHPDVVLCDIGLPDQDGYSVARQLRAVPELASCRLVALTGYAQPEDLRKAKEAGFHEHLAKPPSLEKLRALLAGSTAGS
jgi:PAS domain S-box-containing protein